MKNFTRRIFLVAATALIYLPSNLFAAEAPPKKFQEEKEKKENKDLEKKVITFGVKDSLYPFGFVDEKSRKIIGYDIDFAHAIAKKMGAEAKLTPVTSANRIPMLTEGNVDLLICTMTITEERAKQIDFSYPYFISKQKFIVKKGEIKTINDLKGKRIGTTKGSTSEKNVKIKLPGSDKLIISYDDYPQAFIALTQGRVQAITTDESILAGILAKATANQKKIYVMTDFEISTEPYGVGVKKGKKHLLKVVNETLLEMEKNKSAENVFVKWFGPSSQVPLIRDFKIVPLK